MLTFVNTFVNAAVITGVMATVWAVVLLAVLCEFDGAGSCFFGYIYIKLRMNLYFGGKDAQKDFCIGDTGGGLDCAGACGIKG